MESWIDSYRLVLRDRLQDVLVDMLETQKEKEYHALIKERTRTASFKRKRI